MSNWIPDNWMVAWLPPVLWFVTACTFLLMLMSLFMYVRNIRNFRRMMLLDAQDYARFAVFSSWVRAGGRTTAMEEMVEFGMREQFARAARMRGPEFYTAYEQHETRADRDLDAVIRQLGGTLSHDETKPAITNTHRAGG